MTPIRRRRRSGQLLLCLLIAVLVQTGLPVGRALAAPAPTVTAEPTDTANPTGTAGTQPSGTANTEPPGSVNTDPSGTTNPDEPVVPGPPPVDPPEVVGPGATVGPATAPPQIDVQQPPPEAGRPVPLHPQALGIAPAVITATQGTLTAPAAPPPAEGWITSQEWQQLVTDHRLRRGDTMPALPVLASDLVLAEPVTSAVWTVAGVGLYTPQVNGRPVSSAVLQPGYSDYDQRIEYRSYDVTGLLDTGKNRLSMQLGTGMYDSLHPRGRYSKLVRIGGVVAFTARLDVTLASGATVTTDTTQGWLARAGGTTLADWYGGEDFDSRVLDPAWTKPSWDLPSAGNGGWNAAVRASISPTITLDGQRGPAVSALETRNAASVRRQTNGDLTVDFGSYVTGFPQISLEGDAGRTIQLRPAERLGSNNLPDQLTSNAGSAEPIYDTYTFSGTGAREAWHPQFVYHGFRYLTVKNYPSTPAASQFSVVIVHADLPSTGQVTTNDATLNALFAMTNRSIDANLQSVPTDCPNREKLGWLEQNYLMFDLMANRYDLSQYGKSMSKVVAESQRADGSVPEIAPESVLFPRPFDNDIWWGSALVLVPWKLYEHYGDTETIAAYYDNFRRYVAWIGTKAVPKPDGSDEHLIALGLGDWITVDRRTKNELVETMGYYLTVATLSKIATVLGRADDATEYQELAADISTAINGKYYKDGSYGPDQTSNAMGLMLGIAPDVVSVRRALLDSFEESGGYFHLGEIGLPFAIDALSAMGRDDLVYTAIMKKTQTGFAYYTTSAAGRQGALPEYWDGLAGIGSMAHIILGGPAEWMMDRLAGIGRDTANPGFRALRIEPAVYAGPTQVSASREVGYGRVSVDWTRSGNTATVHVTVPTGGTASVVLPSGTQQVGAGTFTFTTAMGVRPNYLSVDVVRLPWSSALWNNARGRSEVIDQDTFESYGSPTPRTALPDGSVVAFSITGPDLVVRTPDKIVHVLTYPEWQALRFPTPVRIDRAINKYQWAPTAWITLKWTSDPNIWDTRHLTYPEWQDLGFPPIPDRPIGWKSYLYQYPGSDQVYLVDASGTVHWITLAEYIYLGHPRIVLRDQGWIRLPGSGKLAFIDSLIDGTGFWATYEQWQAAGFPVPRSIPIVGLVWQRAVDGGYQVVLVGDVVIPMTEAEYDAAGRPDLED